MKKFLTLFITGGSGYCTIELLWRRYTHWTMFCLGGLCFYMLFFVFSRLDTTPLLLKALLGGTIITFAEFVTGCIVNLLLGWNVWSYSLVPFNLLGQICLSYFFLWILLSIPVAFLCKALRQYI